MRLCSYRTLRQRSFGAHTLNLHALECASEDTDPPGLALVQGTVQRRDELLDLLEDVLRDWHLRRLIVNVLRRVIYERADDTWSWRSTRRSVGLQVGEHHGGRRESL